jgi:hypothetical protein
MPNTPAQSLQEVYQTLEPNPLVSQEQIDAFYRYELNAVRGEDHVKRLAQGLNRNHGVNYFKAFFMGHQGVGKSTELSRLEIDIKGKFQVIRFSAINNLDPRNFKPLDIILTMMVDVAEQTSQSIDQKGAGQKISELRLQEIWGWFAVEKETIEQARLASVNIEGGAGVKADSWWGKILGLFAILKGEMKFTQGRKQEIVEHRFNRLPTLIEIANRLLDDCNALLRESTNKDWLFIGEDFDKSSIPRPVVEELFIGHADIFRKLRAHMIMTLPLSLYYSGRAPELPFSNDSCYVLPDTHVFDRQHQPNRAGRDALAEVLRVRMNLDLFDADQMERLIVASGGNLRDLFALTRYAADTAELRQSQTIGAEDVHRAINNLRDDYQRRLGASPYDPVAISYQDKADRLLKVYEGQPQDQMIDAAIYALLQSRAVQELVNGEKWLGVHPLVVDILARQGLLVATGSGGVLGGTQ